MNLAALFDLVPQLTGRSFAAWPLPGGWRLDVFYLRPADPTRPALDLLAGRQPPAPGCELHLARLVDERGVEVARAWRLPSTATVWDLVVEVAASRGLHPFLEDGRLELVPHAELEARHELARARFRERLEREAAGLGRG